MIFNKHIFNFCVLAALALPSYAADRVAPVASVNGVKIPGELLEFLVAKNVSQGNKDTPELRAALKSELITREVVAQQAKKQKLDQDGSVKLQMQIQETALLADLMLAKQAEKFNTTDEQLRAEYKRQSDLLADADEFQISHVVTATEAEAKAVIKAVKGGEAFDKVAKEKSISPSRQNGGNLGWLLINQLNPTLANVVANLAEKSVTSVPIATPEGWQVIRLDAKRKLKVPAFDDSKPQLMNALFAKNRAEYVEKLVKEAKID